MAVLEARELNVRFGEHLAVDDVSLSIDHGTIVGLIGPNGAGKTTTFNAISGVQRCTGQVRLNGADISDEPPHARARMGMNRTFQRLEVFGTMTVRDNILTAAEITARAHRKPMRGAREATDQIIHLIGLDGIAGHRADALPTGQARLVELGRALATDPQVLLLDEPASGLDESETSRLSRLLSSVAGDGVAILLVEHDIDLVMDLCSTIYVLNFGTVIATGGPEEVREDRNVREAYLGAMV